MVRKPAVAGHFYPGTPDELRVFLDQAVRPVSDPIRALGVVSPHAGYVYSGAIAGAVFGRVEVPTTVILLGPNHTGLGTTASVMSRGSWMTPLGAVPLAPDVAEALLGASPLFEEDALGHAHEHSLEVLLPFLQYRNPGVRIVPVSFMLNDPDDVEEAGLAVASVLQNLAEPVLLVASSDMTHYEPQETAKAKDAKAIERVLAVDARGLLDTTKRFRISMCGVIPTAVLLTAAKKLGATRGELVRYATSGEVSGDRSNVVGYAGMIIR